MDAYYECERTYQLWLLSLCIPECHKIISQHMRNSFMHSNKTCFYLTVLEGQGGLTVVWLDATKFGGEQKRINPKMM